MESLVAGEHKRLDDVCHLNVNGAFEGLPVGIRDPYREVVVHCSFIVQQAAVCHRNHPGTGINCKPASRRIREAIRHRVAYIRVRPTDCPHHRPC